MIGSLPRSALAPMDYRYALDAAMPLLAARSKTLLLCDVPELADEARQRLPHLSRLSEVFGDSGDISGPAGRGFAPSGLAQGLATTHLANADAASSALWIEPMVESWEREIDILAAALPNGAPVVVIASRPLARLLPQRRARGRRPLGMRPLGIGRLWRALPRVGLALEADLGIHSLPAIVLNLLAGQCDRWRRPDLGDRLQFAARLRYCVSGPLAPLSTTALLVARKAGS